MAHTNQARKRIRQAEKHRQHNASLRSLFRTKVKNVKKAIEAKDAATAKSNLQKAIPVIDGMVSKGIIHKHKAARHKSRLTAQVKALS